MSDYGTHADEAQALAREYLNDHGRRSRALWRLAREEADKILRPLVAAEIERIAPKYAEEYAQAACAAVTSSGGHHGYELQAAAQRVLARAIERLEFTATVRPEPTPAPVVRRRS